MNKVLIAKNISHENPGLIQLVLNDHNIPFDVVDLSVHEIPPNLNQFSAFILLGGPASANDDTEAMRQEIEAVKYCLEAEIPFLGVCLGMQVLARASGGSVIKNKVEEIGFTDDQGEPYEIDLTTEGDVDPLFEGMESPFRVFQLHTETVEISGQVSLLGTGRTCLNQIIRAGSCAYGIQCHFELTQEMLKEWCDKDSDLSHRDKSLLLSQFDELNVDYENIGKKMVQNFLRLANLITLNDIS